MNKEIKAYNDKQTSEDKETCDQLAAIIDSELAEAECKIWHAHPVWFLDGNPIVGYSKQKAGIRLGTPLFSTLIFPKLKQTL